MEEKHFASVLCFKGIKHSIIGWDAMKKYNIVLANGEFFVDNEPSKKLNKVSRNNNVIAKRHYTIKPGETKNILGHIKRPIDFVKGEPILIEDVRSANDERRYSDVRAIGPFHGAGIPFCGPIHRLSAAQP